MRNYDFHELLSPPEFQQFAASILRIKEKCEVKTNAMVKDGGIDLYFLNDDTIAQVKNYKNDESQVIKSLKQEAERIRELNPKRYIIVTAAVISKKKREILVSMFQGYLKIDDIIDKDDLNTLLEDKKYHNLEIGYLKLFVPNSFVLEHYLDRAVNNSIYTRTEIELNNIRRAKEIFSVNEMFEKSLDKLLADKAIIISGEAGIGKSILGRMLSAYLINNDSNIEFFSINNLSELFQIYKKEQSQVYFFDDFWGDTRYNFLLTDKEKSDLFQFIELIKKDNNKWLIITTREYILKDGVRTNKKVRDIYPIYKFTVNLKDSSLTSKFNILFKHIQNTDLSWEHLRVILTNWKVIVEEDCYNPRYIETFFNNYKLYCELDKEEFFKKFINYLRNPFEFWEDVLIKQPQEVIVLLIIIALNKNDISIQDLNKKYNELVLKISSVSSNLLEFKDIIKRLEDDFTITQYIDGDLTIKFKNPSYKDFIYDYLKDNMSYYLPYLYCESISVSELVNIWRTLNKDFKIFKDIKEVDLVDKLICDNLNKLSIDDKYGYLLDLASCTEFCNGTRVEKYLIEFTIAGIIDIEYTMWWDNRHFDLIIDLIELLHKKYDFESYIYELLYDIAFDTGDFYFMKEIVRIKKLYPDVYNNFYKNNGKEFRIELFDAVLNYAELYLKEDDLDSLDYLISVDVPEFYDDLEIKLPTVLMKKLDKLYSELEAISAAIKPKPSKIRKHKSGEKEDLSLVESEISELIGANDYVYFDEELKRQKVQPKIKREILKLYEDLILEDLICYRVPLSLICDFLNNNIYSGNAVQFLSDFEDYLVDLSGFSKDEFIEICSISQFSFSNKCLIFKKSDLINCQLFVDKVDVDQLLNSSFFIKRGDWYHFIHPIIQMHLILRTMKDFSIKNIFKIKSFLYLFVQPEIVWSSIDFYSFDDIIVYRLIKKMFPEEWFNEISLPEYRNFVKKIDTENDLEIAKSFLQYFDLIYEYNYDGSCTYYSKKNSFLSDLLIVDFDFAVVDLLLVDLSPSDQINEYLCSLKDNYEDLYVNKKLRNESFIKIFKTSGLVEILNEKYREILNEIEKTD